MLSRYYSLNFLAYLLLYLAHVFSLNSIGLMMDNARDVKKYWSTFCSIDIDMVQVNNLREIAKEQGVRITYTAFVAKAIVSALRDQISIFDHRTLNSGPIARLLVLIKEYLEDISIEWIEKTNKERINPPYFANRDY